MTRFLLLIFLIFLSFYSNAHQEFTIHDLDGNNLSLEMTIDGANHSEEIDYNNFSGQGYYYGKCLHINLINWSDTTVTFTIPTGTYLNSTNADIQDMMVTHAFKITVPPGAEVNRLLWAMCCEIKKLAPEPNYYLEPIIRKDTNLVKLANYFEQNGIQNDIGQIALWAVTDSASLEDVEPYEEKYGNIEKSVEILEELGIQAPLIDDLENQNKILLIVVSIIVGGLALAALITLIIVLLRGRMQKKEIHEII